jgi:hypothetical protein
MGGDGPDGPPTVNQDGLKSLILLRTRDLTDLTDLFSGD